MAERGAEVHQEACLPGGALRRGSRGGGCSTPSPGPACPLPLPSGLLIQGLVEQVLGRLWDQTPAEAEGCSSQLRVVRPLGIRQALAQGLWVTAPPFLQPVRTFLGWVVLLQEAVQKTGLDMSGSPDGVVGPTWCTSVCQGLLSPPGL